MNTTSLELHFIVSSISWKNIFIPTYVEMKTHIPPFLIPLIVGCAIQVIKIFIDFFSHRKISRKHVRSAWWFPSVHWWIAASISTLLALAYGIDSYAFAVAVTFSFLFWYDAANVRYEAWQHASMLNKMEKEISSMLQPDNTDSSLPSLHKQLKERLWHTFTEVIGWILIGTTLTLVYRFI